MPQEIRILVFTKDELRDAVASYLVQRHEANNSDSVAVAELEDCPRVRAKFTIDEEGSHSERWVEAVEIAATLIRHCVEEKIPLPKHSSKWLRSNGEEITLALAINIYDEKLIDYAKNCWLSDK